MTISRRHFIVVDVNAMEYGIQSRGVDEWKITVEDNPLSPNRAREPQLQNLRPFFRPRFVRPDRPSTDICDMWQPHAPPGPTKLSFPTIHGGPFPLRSASDWKIACLGVSNARGFVLTRYAADFRWTPTLRQAKVSDTHANIPLCCVLWRMSQFRSGLTAPTLRNLRCTSCNPRHCRGPIRAWASWDMDSKHYKESRGSLPLMLGLVHHSLKHNKLLEHLSELELKQA